MCYVLTPTLSLLKVYFSFTSEIRMTKEEVEAEAVEAEEMAETKIFSLKVHSIIKEQQQKHGLRHADYQRYRGYCSRRYFKALCGGIDKFLFQSSYWKTPTLTCTLLSKGCAVSGKLLALSRGRRKNFIKKR